MSGKSKKGHTIAKRKRTTGQTIIYKTLHRKPKIDPTENQGVNSCVTEGLADPDPIVPPIVLFFKPGDKS